MQFVLVQRGKCLFAEKAHWVGQAGADGMLVYDHRLIESGLVTMVGSPVWPAPSIYTAFTTFHDSLVLR